MSYKFRAINQDTPYLLPPLLQEWLPEKHLARFVVEILEQLDLTALEARYGGGGKQPYHPALLLRDDAVFMRAPRAPQSEAGRTA